MVAGTEAFRDRAALAGNLTQPDFDGEDSVSYDTVAGFSQLLLDGRAGSLAAGARFENRSEFGSSFVPRLATA